MPAPVALRAEIDLEAVRHNVRALEAAPGDEVMGVVKADAYGHGAVPVARVLEVEGIRRLAVATVLEAVELRDAGIESRILVLAGPLPEFLPAYREHDLEAVVSSPMIADAVADYRIPVHVKVDTGMHRLGIRPEQTASTVQTLLEAGVPVEAVWTHLATADADDSSFVLEQVQRFDAAVADLDDGILVHVANGPAHVRLPRTTSRPALVRLGGVLYGLSSDDAMAPSTSHLRPAMRLVTRVVHVQTVPAGETVSYGRTWTAPRPTRIATLAVGYADGLPRSLSNAGTVGLEAPGPVLRPVVGRVCMDMTMVALEDDDAVGVGDEAVLFGPGGPSAESQAAAAGTISYELTCGLTARVPRVWHALEDE